MTEGKINWTEEEAAALITEAEKLSPPEMIRMMMRAVRTAHEVMQRMPEQERRAAHLLEATKAFVEFCGRHEALITRPPPEVQAVFEEERGSASPAGSLPDPEENPGSDRASVPEKRKPLILTDPGESCNG